MKEAHFSAESRVAHSAAISAAAEHQIPPALLAEPYSAAPSALTPNKAWHLATELKFQSNSTKAAPSQSCKRSAETSNSASAIASESFIRALARELPTNIERKRPIFFKYNDSSNSDRCIFIKTHLLQINFAPILFYDSHIVAVVHNICDYSCLRGLDRRLELRLGLLFGTFEFCWLVHRWRLEPRCCIRRNNFSFRASQCS